MLFNARQLSNTQARNPRDTRDAIKVTALAVLSLAWAKNTTAKAKPKRQLENIRTPQNLQYSLVLPHSRVAHFRALTSGRRISNVAPKVGKLPPYAVQMEPVVQYSQKDPLYDPAHDNLDDVVNKNEIYAQSKILNVNDQQTETDQLYENAYGPPYGSLPTAPLYAHEPYHQHYHDSPEPIIEIIIKESNESLPAPPQPPAPKKKKEPVHVFYVKYSKDPHAKDKVVYDKPIPAITPPSNEEDEHHHEDYVTVTPEPLYQPLQTTTLRAIIKPESEVYHSDGSVKVTFGSDQSHHSGHYSDRRDGNTETHEETAPRPAIVYPQQQPKLPPLERSANPNSQYQESAPRTVAAPPSIQTYRSSPQHAQSRIQFQQPFLSNEQQLPRQNPSIAPFRTQSHLQRQNPFGASGPFGHVNHAISGPSPGPLSSSISGGPPSVPGLGPTFGTSAPRLHNSPPFHIRPSNIPSFSPRPQHFNSPPRPTFHSGPQRPLNTASQGQNYFDDPKYLQENYHTITTEQIEQSKEQSLPNRQQNFNFVPRPSPSPSASPIQFQDHNRPQHIPVTQQLPQQRPPQQFIDTIHNKPSFSVAPSGSPFYNLKPSPPHLDENRPPTFLQSQKPQNNFDFHKNPQLQIHNRFPSGPLGPTQSSITTPLTSFVPQPSPTPQFAFHPQPSPTPNRPFTFFQQNSGPSERPSHSQINPSAAPSFAQPHGNFQDPSVSHQQNVGAFAPNGGELVPAISKYEQHITVNDPTTQPQIDYSGLSSSGGQSSSTSSQTQQQFKQEIIHQQAQHEAQLRAQKETHQRTQHEAQQRAQHEAQQRAQHEAQQRAQQEAHQRAQHEARHRAQQEAQQQAQQASHQQVQHSIQQQNYDAEQEQVRLQLAQNVKKQQEEIQRLQQQLLLAQQQQQQQHSEPYQQNYRFVHNGNSAEQSATSANPQYSEGLSRHASSTPSPLHYQSTSRTVEIKPTTQKYSSSTTNSISTTPETKKQETKKTQIQLPDEVPDDLRQQLLSSGILDNADISVLDYDKIGDTSLDSLPPDQLANFFSAGGAQQIASSETRPIFVKPNGEKVESIIDDDETDQEPSASENIPSYVAPSTNRKREVEMKVVHFDPSTEEGQNIAKEYVKEDATQLDTVALNDKKYNRYLPLKVSGNQFPLPDILKGKKITSVVVLAPVETELLSQPHSRTERAADSLKGIKFLAGDSLQDVLKKPTAENFKKWLEVEKKTVTDQQSVILLVTGNDDQSKEIFMYDIGTGGVNKLDGDLSNAFVEAAENNSLSKDIEQLAIEGDGTPESFVKKADEELASEGSENVPFLVDLSGLRLDRDENNRVSISSGYSKTKLGRSLRRH
ncbi:hypothetical protein EVAR_41002_1 [Eumeta japonica]|uniref:Uncharacterized protein n=1 Tax=Eumeta variegata TaxID=151549 RepID=A0A4C1XHN4_EUMVA|nr:hypothetical protein EVAR_41002_1 [Eumeta japonica]